MIRTMRSHPLQRISHGTRASTHPPSPPIRAPPRRTALCPELQRVECTIRWRAAEDASRVPRHSLVQEPAATALVLVIAHVGGCQTVRPLRVGISAALIALAGLEPFIDLHGGAARQNWAEDGDDGRNRKLHGISPR